VRCDGGDLLRAAVLSFRRFACDHRCCHTRALEALITHRLKATEGVVKTRTLIVLSTVKETQVPPLEHLHKP
jgi:hypothetical protein